MCICCCCLVATSCLTLCNPTDCSLPGSSVHGISQARILEWGVISFSWGSSQPRDGTYISCIGRGFFTTEPLGKPHMCTHTHTHTHTHTTTSKAQILLYGGLNETWMSQSSKYKVSTNKPSQKQPSV